MSLKGRWGHRLFRGSHRQANAALYRIAIVRMRWHQPTIGYVRCRTAESLPWKDSGPLVTLETRPHRNPPTKSKNGALPPQAAHLSQIDYVLPPWTAAS